MSVAPWRQDISGALHRNRSAPESRYFQLATVCSEGIPRNRTVVFRGFADGCDDVMLVTDARSQKISHIAHNPRVEICWYFARTREQFRIEGTAHAVYDAGDARRQEAWERLSAAGQEQFFWPEPGAVQSGNGAGPASVDAGPPDSFVLVTVRPERVDHLELKKKPQARTIHTLESGRWRAQPVNP